MHRRIPIVFSFLFCMFVYANAQAQAVLVSDSFNTAQSKYVDLSLLLDWGQLCPAHFCF